jgi:hypothetical protein
LLSVATEIIILKNKHILAFYIRCRGYKVTNKKINKVILSLLFLLILMLSGCEIDTTLSIDKNLPPTFDFSGSGYLDSFVVREVIGRNKDPQKLMAYNTRDIWKIFPKDHKHIRMHSMPKIKYGQVPSDFTQAFPKDVYPEQLVENKVYSACVITVGANGDFVDFIIKDGKVILANRDTFR